jgi:hypothetical protein
VNRLAVARALAAPALVAVALILAAGPVAAGTPDGHRGTWGAHFLADSREFPGARCRYDGDQNLAGIRVRDPFVFAVDRTGGRDRQRVGWQVIVQALSDDKGAEWANVRRSPVQKALAADATPADFSSIGVPVDGSFDHAYRVKVRMFWYRPGHPNQVTGVATHTVRWYRYPLAEANEGFCPGGIL